MPVCFVGKAIHRHNEVIHNIDCNRRKVAELIPAKDVEHRFHLVFHAASGLESKLVQGLHDVAEYIHAYKKTLMKTLP